MENIRDFLTLLEKHGDLTKIDAEVSAELEITEITKRTIRANGPALMFENVSGYDMPVVINLFGSHQRMAWALGVDDVQKISDRVTPNGAIHSSGLQGIERNEPVYPNESEFPKHGANPADSRPISGE